MTWPNGAPVLLAGYGNPWAGADAFGCQVARAVLAESLPGLQVLLLENSSYSLLDHLAGRQALVIVDAAWRPDWPTGVVFECDWDSPDRPELLSQRYLSTHGLSVAAELDLARGLHLLPPVVRLVALNIDPEQAAIASDLPSPRVVTQAVDRILALVRRFAASPPPEQSE